MNALWARAVAAVGALALLVSCGGSGKEEPVPPAPTAPTVGAAGGSVTDATGAAVTVPAGALDSPVTLRIARDATGAPPLPEGLAPLGDIFALTPHGHFFAAPATLQLPLPTTAVPDGARPVIAKTSPSGQWEMLTDSTLADGKLSASIDGFSWVVATWTNGDHYFSPTRTDCGGEPCSGVTESRANVTFSWTATGGTRLDSRCSASTASFVLQSRHRNSSGGYVTEEVGRRPVAAGLSGSISVELGVVPFNFRALRLQLHCPPRSGSLSSDSLIFDTSAQGSVSWLASPQALVAVMEQRGTVEVVAGTSARLAYVFTGGGSRPVSAQGGLPLTVPSATDRAVVDWQRSASGLNGSWTPVARAYQDEANPLPVSTEREPWWFWGLHHDFVPSAADHLSYYRVQVCYSPTPLQPARCVTSNNRRIIVLQTAVAPTITDAPTPLWVRQGETASFTVRAAGAPTPLLQWETRAPNANGAWSLVTSGNGGTATTYVTAPLTLADNGRQYRVVATNAAGSVASAPVMVAVSELDIPPNITTHPAALRLVSGQDAVFAVNAEGTAPMSYQWTFNGQPLAGANAPVLRLPGVQPAQAGVYRVQVSNRAGAANTFTLMEINVAGPALGVQITTQPVPVTVHVGNTATLAVGATGSPPLNYQWLKDGTAIPGANQAYYTVAAAAGGDSGSYQVRVSNGASGAAGALTSDPALLTVKPATTAAAPIVVLANPSPQVQPAGGSATFTVAFTGTGPVNYQWLKDGNAIAGANGAALTLTRITGNDEAAYAVTVGNALGSVTTQPARLTVLGSPAINAGPQNSSVAEGATATFGVTASGSDLRYQWTRNSVAIPGATAASHTTPTLGAADSGAVYGVVVYNDVGVQISAPAVLTVTPPAASAWQTPRLISEGSLGAPVVAIDDRGRSLALWTTRSGRLASATSEAGQGWAGTGFADAALTGSQGSFTPNMVAAPDGTVVAAWGYTRGPGQWLMAAARGSTAGLGAAETLSTQFTSDSIQLAIDDSGRAALAYDGGSRCYLRISVPGSAWSDEIDLVGHANGSSGGLAQVAVNSRGEGFVVYQEGGTTIVVIPLSLGRATPLGTAQRIRQTSVSDPRIAVDEAGGAVLAYYSSPSRNWEVWAQTYTPAGGWSVPAVLDDDSGFDRMLALASDGQGNAVVAWMKQTVTSASNGRSYNTIQAARHAAGAGWAAPQLMSTPEGDDAENVQVAASRSGRFVVSWTQEEPVTFNSRLYARQYDNGWRPTGPVQQSGQPGWSGYDPLPGRSLALSPNTGRGVVLWLESNDLLGGNPLYGAFLP